MENSVGPVDASRANQVEIRQQGSLGTSPGRSGQKQRDRTLQESRAIAATLCLPNLAVLFYACKVLGVYSA